ncbi:MAG: ATP-binding protein, partial [Myxococcales bacterium]|nr:ATP-binding protein [Myxococcales bacterium]
GSSAVDIWLDFIPDEGGAGEGVIEIHVDDGGEGMSGEIIDSQLTTLFSSSKENDLTKIGKFGIGFVSVFALRPRAVLVHTGRDGEYWEVFFDQDRSFFKSRLETPVEGTQITLFVAGDRARYTELVAASRETIDHWCRHSEAEISFEDRASVDGELVQINRPFAVEGLCPTSFEREGTQIVLAYSNTPAWGFYNKGLALAVVRGKTDLVPPRLAHIAFRIKSRYLEHTLTRDNVIRDQNYDKAMAIVAKLAATKLVAALFEALAEHTASLTATAAAPPPERSDPLLRLLRERAADFLTREQAGELKLDPRLWQLPIIPRIGAPPCSLAECRKQRGGWWLAPSPSPTCGALHRDGQLVVAAGHRDTALQNLLILATGKSPQLVESLCTATPASAVEHVLDLV